MASKLPLFLFVPFAISCGGDDTPHTIKTPDSNMGSGGSGSAVTDTCKVDPTYASLSFMGSDANARATEYPTGSLGSNQKQFFFAWGAMENVGSDTMVADYINVEMYAGFGVFAGSDAIGSGTYVIANDETSYIDCALCVYIQGDYDLVTDDGTTTDDFLMAKSGTVTLTSVSGSSFKATLSNVDFRRVTQDADGPTNEDQTDIPCTTHVDTTTFDITLNQYMGSGSGSGSATGKPVFTSNGRPHVIHHRRY